MQIQKGQMFYGKKQGGPNTLEDLRTGHYKNSYGVEGMCVTGRNDYKKIVPVPDEMKQHVLDDVKQGYYKYNGMSGDNEAEWDAYYRRNNEYYKTLNKEDRLSACWTLGQLHLEISSAVADAVREKIPGWSAGKPIPKETLDEIFADERITSILEREAPAPVQKTDSIEISAEGRLAAEQALQSRITPEKDEEKTSEQQGGKVAVNEGKRLRQIAAAANQGQVQQVLMLLQGDLADCKEGLEKGWCDEDEVAKVEALIARAKARMSEVPRTSDDNAGGMDAFDMASLM